MFLYSRLKVSRSVEIEPYVSAILNMRSHEIIWKWRLSRVRVALKTANANACPHNSASGHSPAARTMASDTL